MERTLSCVPLLEVADLHVQFPHRGRMMHAVDGISYTLFPGQTLAIVGESGSGKTVSCRALMGLLPTRCRVSGSIRFAGQELVGLGERDMRRVRGTGMAMVFQDPGRALNPTIQIGRQIEETVRAHQRCGRAGAQRHAVELLSLMKLNAPEQLFHAYPHQLSGGMQQRVMIALALAGQPTLLIADEATRSLDVTTQVQILALLKSLQHDLKMAIIMISHDLIAASHFAENILVMHGGRVVEILPATHLFTHAQMPYTQALLSAIGHTESAASYDRKVAP
jgi:ABC-type dipeptide/oligopeptide/nickel transport system ATPase component